MIAGMTPVRRDGAWVFCTLAGDAPPDLVAEALATFREDEGLSLILPLAVARAHGLPVDQPMTCITLGVYSALDGVGLTAAVAGALAGAGIACNMVAAFHHDHAFVPEADAERALTVLRSVQAEAGQER
jgi:hypothetical protein